MSSFNGTFSKSRRSESGSGLPFFDFWTSPSGSETETADQITFWYDAVLGQRAPLDLAAASRAAEASFFVHHTVPSRSRTAGTKTSRRSHFARGFDDSRAARVTSVISKRSLSGRSTVI